MPGSNIDALIAQAAQENNLPQPLLRALLTQESSLDPNAHSSAGAIGMAQLMPTTARQLGVNDPTDPTQAIPAAARYLRQGLDKYGGNVSQALQYYFGGPNEQLWGPKTKAYPAQVMARLQGPIVAPSAPALQPNALATNPYTRFSNALAAPTRQPASDLSAAIKSYQNNLVRLPDGLVAQRIDHNPFAMEPVEHDPFALAPVDHDPFNQN